MSEQQAKELCKALIEHGNKPLNHDEKELIKAAIDQSKSFDQLMFTMLIALRK